jgi:hypothetical protein
VSYLIYESLQVSVGASDEEVIAALRAKYRAGCEPDADLLDDVLEDHAAARSLYLDVVGGRIHS